MKHDPPIDPSTAPHVHPKMRQIRACCDQRDAITHLMSRLGELHHEADCLNTWYRGKGEHYPCSLLLKSSMGMPDPGSTFILFPGHQQGLQVKITIRPNGDCWFSWEGFDEERWSKVIPERLMRDGPHRISTEEAMKLVEDIITHFAKLEANGWKPLPAT